MMSDNMEDRMTEISNEVSLTVKVNKLKKTSFTKTVSSIIVKVKC